MATRTVSPKGRSLLRLAVAGAVVAGAPLALAGTAEAAPDSAWDALAQCESGGNWSINTGNGYYGGLQFSLSTWRAFGGDGMPHQASRSQQIAVAERTLAAQGWNAWPSCSRQTGVRGHDAEPTRVRASAPAPAAAPAAPAVAAAPTGASHTVVAGDTLSRIATANGTTWQQLWANNQGTIGNPNVLSVGQVVNL